MPIASSVNGHPVAVFDLDGCLARSPSSTTIQDFTIWERIWANLDHPCNSEMVELLKALRPSHHIAILTARPERYRDITLAWLENHGIWTSRDDVSLTMRPEYDRHGDCATGGIWKLHVVRHWKDDLGIDIRFVVEDYKPNADAIRSVVPVLLYEQLR